MSIPKPEKRIAEFEKMAYGMFIHWGLYSQLGMGEWVKAIPGIPDEEYDKLVDTFTGKDFDADKIVLLAKNSGMKYITLTTRHHDGFSLYDTKELGTYNSLHSPAKRDFIREFTDACHRHGIVPFLYHTTLDWHNKDFDNNFDAYLEYLRRSVEILCTNYGKIGGFWFDGNWSKPDADWKLDDLYGTIRKYQPDAMIINNTGLSARGETGHPEIDSVTFEQGLPHPIDREGMKKYVSGEMCFTLNDHWAYGKNDYNYKTPAELIKTLCKCRRAGANLLLNIGPDGDGAVPEMMSGILSVIGRWIEQTKGVIYEGKPCGIAGNGDDFGLKTEDGRTYLFVFDLPIVGNESVTVNNSKVGPRAFTGVSGKVKAVKWLDNDRELPFSQNEETGLFSFLPTGYPYGSNMVVRVAELLF
ncbi:MAG TPA: alpha-L-fucosidase [Candidatus Merdivicinus intestinavium]|nr:alpha-L-fucosidase [Candidatus Merdivicinus intestinavium]